MSAYRNLLIGMIYILSPLLVQAEYVNIGIINHYNIQRISFTAEYGNYSLFADNRKIADVNKSGIVFLYYKNGKVGVKSGSYDFGTYEKVYFIGKEVENGFRVTPIIPEKRIRSYEDNLKITAVDGELQLVNNIELEHYIPGVVQAEVGPHPAPEFFKLQAILVRTYALDNLSKHEHEGYNLCDKVHCQAYYNKCSKDEIKEASIATKGLVIVDSDIKLITAAFYSNCGGQTVNSEDVWQKPVYYLRSVKDPYCVNEPNAKWSKKIPKSKWDSYINRKCNPMNGQPLPVGPFYQPERKAYFEHGEAEIPLKNIRADWRLKSTFFSAVPNGDYVELTGRGFGHGTGLCQEGAMRMAATGHSYPEILHFYYKDVHLVDLGALDFFRDDPQ